MSDCPNIKIMKKLWYLISILIISALLINVISADTSTYTNLSWGTIVNRTGYLFPSGSYSDIERTPYFNYDTNSLDDLRYTSVISSDGVNLYLGVVVKGNYNFYNKSIVFFNANTNSSRGSYGLSTQQITVDNQLYTIGRYDQSNYLNSANIANITIGKNSYNNDFPNNSTGINQNLVYYSFGAGAENIVNYSDLIINYAQDIRTTGNGSDNMDLITWNAFRDTAGNDLKGKNIEIQAIAGYFEGSSYADLKTSLFSDWQASTHPAVTMYKGDIEQSHQEYTWEEVAYNFRSLNTLGTWFWNIFADNDTWYQYGWRYQARLLDENLEPLTEWQTLYTGNSYTPSATETFTDDEPLTPDDVETINDINEQNGTTNNWYINNTVINNNEYNQTWQQNIIENIYNILQGTPDPVEQQHATDVQNTIDNAIDQEDNYINDLGNQLQDLQLPDISENNGLMNALRWVREVHHETIEETQLGTVVLVTMIIGLITYLIGRRNG